MIFINALFLYPLLFNNSSVSDIFISASTTCKFVALMICIQILYDILYYLFITYSGFDKTNDYVAFFKEYAEDYSYRAIYSDSIYLALWSILFYLVYNSSNILAKYYIVALGGFIMVMMSYEDM